MLTDVSMSVFMDSACISSGLAAFRLLRVIMAFLIRAGLSQLMGSYVSADGRDTDRQTDRQTER